MFTVHLMALLVACTEPEPSPRGPPTNTFPSFYGEVPKNVLMISIDTFRRDHLGRYDPEGDVTPFLTKLAEAGVALDDHTTCSNWTFAGIACTLQGRTTEEAGFTPKLTANGQAPWPDGDRFLAGHLADQLGFVSVASSTNGWFSQEWGLTQGYDDAFHPSDSSAMGAWKEGFNALTRVRAAGPVNAPWMLHVHLIEPHVPYVAPGPYNIGEELLPAIDVDLTDKDEHYDLTRDEWPDMDAEEQAVVEAHLRVRYRGELRYMDDQIADFMATADALGLLDDTLVVVWTDHGEQFWEHGYQSHAYTLHREENDGVAFFWSKNIVPAAWDGPTQSIDLAPTLLTLLGGEVPAEMTGYPLGEAPDDRERYSFTVARLGAAQSVRRGDLKLAFNWSGGLRFYDLAVDPEEAVDAYDPADPRVAELWSSLGPRVRMAQPLAPEFPIRWPEELPTPP